MKISQNLFTYSLNKDDMTASIIKCDSSNKDIIIPRSITYSNQDYVIKKFVIHVLHTTNILKIFHLQMIQKFKPLEENLLMVLQLNK